MRHGVSGQTHAPQHQEYAHRAATERDRHHAHEGALHELEFGEGSNQKLRHREPEITRRCDDRRPREDRRPRPSGAPAAGSRRSEVLRSAPGDRFAGDEKRLGKTRLTRSISCRTATTVRASACQRRTRSSRSAVVLASMAVKGSSRRISGRILQQQAGKQGSLHLPSRQRADRGGARSRSGPLPQAPPRCGPGPRGRPRREQPDRDHRPMATRS